MRGSKCEPKRFALLFGGGGGDFFRVGARFVWCLGCCSVFFELVPVFLSVVLKRHREEHRSHFGVSKSSKRRATYLAGSLDLIFWEISLSNTGQAVCWVPVEWVLTNGLNRMLHEFWCRRLEPFLWHPLHKRPRVNGASRSFGYQMGRPFLWDGSRSKSNDLKIPTLKGSCCIRRPVSGSKVFANLSGLFRLDDLGWTNWVCLFQGPLLPPARFVVSHPVLFLLLFLRGGGGRHESTRSTLKALRRP